jgi:CRP-like cAMP-binding protein
MLTTLEKVDLLQHVRIFREIPTESLVRIAAIAQEVEFKDRQLLFDENGAAEAMFVLLKGQVTLTCEMQDERRLGEMQTVGEMALLADLAETETARACRPTVALKISHEAFYEAMAEDINVVRGILRALIGMIPTRMIGVRS